MNVITTKSGPELTECIKLASMEKIKYRVDVHLDEEGNKVCDVQLDCDEKTFQIFAKRFKFKLEH